ncbi:MAG TPA: efflux RND transporter permease subunit [Candidatus Binataceae bacterium]|nr:efflux RND transporter permease subunit [Candidatus Binataceae bacterium]
MLKAIVEFSIRLRGVVIALACLIVLYGLYVTYHAKLGVFPEFAPPEVVIQTEAPGFSPEQVETLVTQPIENALAGTIGLQSIRSQSIQGLSVATVVFKDGTDIYRARQLAGERLLEIASAMPAGVAAPAMAPLTSATAVIMDIGLTSVDSNQGALMALRTFADWTLRPRLLAVTGVAHISIYGGDERELQIQIDPARLVEHQLGIGDVTAAARAATGVRGAGFIETANQRVVIHSEGQSITPAQLGDAIVAHRKGSSVRLRDVAAVRWAPAPAIGGALIMGKPGVIAEVTIQFGANALDVTGRVDGALRDLGPLTRSEGIVVWPALFRAASFVTTTIDNVRFSLLLGGVLVAIVLVMFLHDLRTAFISLTAIPLSLLIAIITLQTAGVTLNTMTLGGLAIAIGEVVDDAIIDVENVLRRLGENRALAAPRPAFEVILDASLEVRGAVVYATFIVALVFLPVLAMSGVQGRIFAPLGWAYILAIMASLAVALTLTPALCYAMLSEHRVGADTALVKRLKSMHRRALERASANPDIVIGGAAILCLLALGVLPFFGGSFLPELQERSFVLHMVAVPGTSLRESMRAGGEVTKVLLANPHVQSAAQRIGRAELGEDTLGPQESEFDVRLKPLGGADVDDIEDALRKKLAGIPGFAFSMNSFLTERIQETLSGEQAGVVISVFGNDLDVLDREAGQIAAVLGRIRGATAVAVQSPGGMPQITVRLDRKRLVQFGFRPLDVLDAIASAYQGAIVAQVYDGIRVFDVCVILDPKDRRRPEAIGNLMLRNAQGQLMPLDELATVALTSGRYAILHSGARRVQVVTCNAGGDLTSFVALAEREVRQRVPLAAGNYLEFSGAAQARAQAVHEIAINSSIAAVIVICLLFIALGSTRNLMLVLANVPFAFVGGVFAALVTGGWLSLGSLVGFVTLFGITMRNSIMMISHFEHLVESEGMTWGPEAALRGASERLTPILMTAIVTALGLLPLAIGSGSPGREIEGPMAIIILGGLFSSTALNLLVLPTMALRWGRFGSPR